MIAALRALATHPAARGLRDDAAVIDVPLGRRLVATHDVLVEGVHYTPACPAGDVAWKLVATNLSDLAAMGATPLGMLLGLTLAREAVWTADFIAGLGRVAALWDCPLLGGDTVSGPAVLGLTALGAAAAPLSRMGARVGDELWLSGTVGDAGLGLRMALGEMAVEGVLLKRYRRPVPRLGLGAALAGVASAAMDVSDGLLIDAARLGEASGVGVAIELDAVPLSDAVRALLPAGEAGVLAAAASGDDYELLFTAAPAAAGAVRAAGAAGKVAVTRIGRVLAGAGLRLRGADGPVALPARLGFEHGRGCNAG
ncbi:thiamine-phosphate kinase [Sandaracinobacteroides saxicola]|uniref:thiamine-phosphate kinase n=1 Tax=Sandaracinobacteroides saxicola TaxID=2759707 RepID=UPI001FB0E76D|nr:thiamine-phosphate kinase [Sandaracinobacteroides saxicola]